MQEVKNFSSGVMTNGGAIQRAQDREAKRERERLEKEAKEAEDKRLAEAAAKRIRLREERAIYLGNVQELKKKFPKIVIYDAINTLCTAGVCNGKIAGEYMYFDDNHLNSKGSELILNDLNQLISKEN
jgi:lysophospholipase L1-like esterase